MDEHDIDCPYCGESIGLLIDSSIPEQQYVEDCPVCCSPMLLNVEIDVDGNVTKLTAVQENE